jgi:hypothetical protein
MVTIDEAGALKPEYFLSHPEAQKAHIQKCWRIDSWRTQFMQPGAIIRGILCARLYFVVMIVMMMVLVRMTSLVMVFFSMTMIMMAAVAGVSALEQFVSVIYLGGSMRSLRLNVTKACSTGPNPS